VFCDERLCQNLSQDASLLSVIYIDNAHSVWFNNNNNQYFQQVMSLNCIWTALKSACLLFCSRLQEVLCIFTVLTSLLSILWVLALSHTMLNVIIFTISRLTEHNFVKWLVDIWAHLHWSKLWKYTQKNVNVMAEEESKKMNKWEKAVNLITSTLSAEIKRKLTKKNFNNEYKMFTKLSHLLQPDEDTQFMRLICKYYTLWFDDNEFLFDFLTHVKILEEHIDLINVQMNNNKQTLLCLSMSLSVRYHFLIQIWSVTDDMTAAKATKMLLKEKWRLKNDDELNEEVAMLAIQGEKKRVKCSHCEKTEHAVKTCWRRHSETLNF